MNIQQSRPFSYRQHQPIEILKNDVIIHPWSVVFDVKRNHIITSDVSKKKDCLHWFDRSTLQHMATFGTQNKGVELGEFHGPVGMCLQPITEHLIVCESPNNRVQVLSLDDYNAPVPLFAIGRKPLQNDDYDHYDDFKKSELYQPFGVCCSPCGGMFIAEITNHRIQSFDSAGRFITIFGNGNKGNDDELKYPSDICFVHPHFSPSFLASGMLCVSESIINRISIWDCNSKSSSQHLFNFKVPDFVMGVCMDQKGYLHVSCGGPSHNIQIYDFRMVRYKMNKPSLIQTLGRLDCNFNYPCKFDYPSKMCVDHENILMVADRDHHQIQMFCEKK